MADTSRPRRKIIADPNGALPQPTTNEQSKAPAAAAGSQPPPWRRPAESSTQSPSLNVEGLKARIAQNQAVLDGKLAALLGRLTGLRLGLDAVAERVTAQAQTEAQASASRAEAVYQQGQRVLETRRETERAQLVSQANEILELIAPEIASSDWIRDVSGVAARPNSLTAYQRIGWVAPTGVDSALPVVHPLPIGSGWVLSGALESSGNLLLSTLSRLLVQVHPSNLRIHAFDPRSSGTLAQLAGIRAASPATFARPYASAAQFIAPIHEALAIAPLNAERVALAGASDFVDLLRREPATDAVLNVFVLLDYPYGVSAELATALQQFASLGRSSGTLLLLQENSAISAPERVDASQVSVELARIEMSRDRITSKATASLTVQPDAPMPAEALKAVIEHVRGRLSGEVGRTIRLEDLLEADLKEPWSHSSLEDVEALLGVAGQSPISISFRTENPPHSNVLLGGMVGTGKSNALKDLIYSMAVRYSPDELDLILLDFKAGIEFKSFDADHSDEGWLPHVSVLGLESDQEYGVAVLESVATEIDRRSRLFRDAGGAASIVRYREATRTVMPRLVVVVDEFHVILEGDEELAQQAADLLEQIAKQGRAFGVHLLLASQALTGIRGLRTKADAIFSQFPVRISLKNSESESQAFLSQGNKAAAELTYRGEVVVNRNLGQQPELDNVRGLAAFVDQDTFGAIQRTLWQRDHRRRPAVFLGSSFAKWDVARLDALPRSSGARDGIDLWVGRPVAVDDGPLALAVRSDADQLVAIVGGDQGRDRVAPAVLASMIVSAAAQLPRGSEIVILDASADDTLSALVPALDHARAHEMRVTVIAASDIAQYLRDTLFPRIDDHHASTAQLVIGLALQRVGGLDDEPSSAMPPTDGFSFGAPSAPTARDVLASMARRGAIAGVYFVGWWTNLTSLEQTVGLAHNGVLAYVTVASGLEDLKKIAGPLTKKLGGSPRVGVYDRRSDAPLRPTVPFHPWQHPQGRRDEVADV